MRSIHALWSRIVLPAALLALPSGCSSPRLVVPAPGAGEYASLSPAAVHAVTPQALVVVGSLERTDGTPEGLILSSETSGRTWRRLGSEVHDLRRVVFQTVYFSDRLRGWAGGVRVDPAGSTRAIVFRTEDGGNHWREVPLLLDPELIVTLVHSLAFSSDTEGTVTAMVTLPGGERKETRFGTTDAGRTWNVLQFRDSVALRATDESVSMLDDIQGFRIRTTDLPGVTSVDATASGGRDWMPIAELSARNLDTYYGQGR